MQKFSVTFETLTHESVENGECEDSGYIATDLTFAEAVRELGYGEGGTEPSCSNHSSARWITAYKTNEDYRTGETENRSLHIPIQVTASSRERICRYICNRR